MIQISQKCVGCGKCTTVCPFGALSLANRKAVASAACTMCGACVSQCPVGALSLPINGAAKKDLSAYKGIWVFLEIADNASVRHVRSVGYELLSKGRELANQVGEELCAVIIGNNIQPFFAEISQYGADKIILGADVKDGFIHISGWKDNSSVKLFDFLNSYQNKGINNILCTDINKDGTLKGPATSLYRQIMSAYPDCHLIASGGISSIDDLNALDKAGIPAVVFGKAIYEGRIDLSQVAKQFNL